MSRHLLFLGLLTAAWSFGVLTRADEPRLDAQGDPLPAGATARLGTLRFRAAAEVKALIFAPDGRTLVSGAGDGVIRFWDLKTGNEVRRLTGHEHGITCLAFSPDGKTLASGSHDQTARLWDVATGKQLQRIPARKSWVTAVTFSPDGKALACGNRGDLLTLHDVATGQETAELIGHGIWVTSVVFSPDGKQVISGAKDRTIRRWDRATGKEIDKFEGQSTMVYALALAPDGKTLASGSNDYVVHLWDMATGKEQRKLEGHRGSVHAVAWSADGKTIASASRDGSVRIWDAETGKEQQVIAAEQGELAAIAMAPDGKAVASAGRMQTIRIWDTATGKEAGIRRDGHSGGIVGLAFTPDGRELVTASLDRTFRVWSSAGTRRLTIDAATRAPLFFTLAPGGKALASIGDDHSVRLWSLADGSRQDFRDVNTNEIVDVAFSPEGELLAWFSGPANRQIQNRLNIMNFGNYHDLELRGLGDGKLRQRFEIDTAAFNAKRHLNDPVRVVTDWPGHTGRISAVAVAHGRTLVASGCNDKSIVLWEVARGKLIHKMLGHEGGIASLAFTPDDRILISTATDGTIRLWEVAARAGIGPLLAPKAAVRLAVLSPDGRTLAFAAGHDPHIRLRDLVRNRDLPSLQGHTDTITALAFSPDGKTLASGSADTTVLLWDVATTISQSRLKPDDLLGEVPDPGKLWASLAIDDSGAAYAAIWTLTGSKPDLALAFFKQRIKLEAGKQRSVSEWIDDLDSGTFQVRRAATEALENLGELARPDILEALSAKPSFEMRRRLEQILTTLDNRKGVPSGSDLRQIRAVVVLEWLGTPEAKDFLQQIAKGPPTWWQTREARAALGRLDRRPAP